MVLTGCTAGASSTTEHRAEATSAPCRAVEVPFGSATDRLGLDPGGDEHLARGPQAAAITRDGDLLVLDSVRRRVVALDPAGPRVVVDDLAPDVEDLAVADDGALAVFGPLQSKVWLFEADGSAAGEVAIDRALRHTAGIAFGPSRTIVVRSAYQELHSAGSPAAPVALATQLQGKREGAFVLPDGNGVLVRTIAGGVELAVATQGDGRRSRVTPVRQIHDVDAASLFGVAGSVACMRTERLGAGTHIAVSRRAVCVDVATGQLVLDRALAPVGPYLPAHELALGGTPSRLVALEPALDQLTVRVCEVTR